MGIENLRAGNTATTMELTLDAAPEPTKSRTSGLDSEANRKIHQRLMDWFLEERERQSVNRFQMSLDHDFYDSLQWAPEDAEEVMSRGQAPLVFNEVGPMCDWLIGTERRTRVDWSVLPRTEDDVAMADIKTNVLKYITDVNRTVFQRSRAFADAIKGGVGWLEVGVTADPTKEILFSRNQDWRHVLYDSASYELDLSDARYLFRWKWVDLDMAIAFLPHREAQLRRAATSAQLATEDDDIWYLGDSLRSSTDPMLNVGRRTYVAESGTTGNRRERVKIIEAWWRDPVRAQVLHGDLFDGEAYDPKNPMMVSAVRQGMVSVVEQVRLKMRTALLTEECLLAIGDSPYRHQRFPFIPVWCYRRSRDRMPYGAIRRVRDIQEDLNKRASKSLYLLSTNQVFAEEGATDDWDALRDEVDHPAGTVVYRAGKKLEVRRDSEMAKGHLDYMQMDALKIQQTGGVNNENLGRQTNAVSGEAIKARQMQGSVATTEPFDNLRFSVQTQGELLLSLAEQFYSEPKVLRLTGARQRLDWVKINQPEIQADGSIRWINDITATQADFVVAEQDFHGTLRQAMFEQMMQLIQKMPPELAVRFLRLAFEYSDFPNKDEIVAEIRRLIGEPDPKEEQTPEGQQAMAAMKQQQAAAMQMQQQAAVLALEEQQAKVNKLNAEAREIMERTARGPENDASRQIEDAVRNVQMQAADQMDQMAQKLLELQTQLKDRTLQIDREADTKVQIANIEADAAVRVAEINKSATDGIDALVARMDQLAQSVKGVEGTVSEVVRSVEEIGTAVREAPEAPEAPEPAPAPPAATIVFEEGAIQVDARRAPTPTTSTITGTGPDGKPVTLTVERTPTENPKPRRKRKEQSTDKE